MDEYEENLKKIQIGRNTIQEKLKKLENDSKVQKYLELKKDFEKIEREYKKEYINYIECKCNSCKHLFAVSKIDEDRFEGRMYYEYGCLKCGLETGCYERDYSLEDEAYINYLRNHSVVPYNNSGLFFNSYEQFKNARIIYEELKNKYIDLDDKYIIQIMKENLEKSKVKLLVKND